MATETVAQERSTVRASINARTLRTDRWWILPLVTFVGFAAFIVYSTWAAFDHHNIYAGHSYLSPFYSPCLTDMCPPEARWAAWNIGNWFSPALLILIFPLGFRTTCYYYRKAYYRSFWFSPPACAVAEPHKSYSGETRFPLLIQNIHRYFWYPAAALAGILTYDAVESFIFKSSGGDHFQIGVGSFVYVANAVLIIGYTFGCHSCRHITAGRINHFSKHPVRYKWWTFVSWLNKHHIRWAWASLIWIAVVDLYVRLVATGNLHDYHHIFGAMH
ncbi:MAG TPA: hypothetical protein VHB18_05080 [Mycobacteriales bacterium]|jgi:hypothetical protein|nr:hypothetical protein [Mycobacteriales bacterium]